MVLPVVGMNEYFVKKVLGRHEDLTEDMVVELLEQDAFSETFVPTQDRMYKFLHQPIP